MMDIETFQNKLNEIKELAAQNEKVLTGEQVKDFFDGLNPNKEQLLQILKYLKMQGITIEGLELDQEQGVADAPDEEERKIELTAGDKEYLKEYKKSLAVKFEEAEAEALFEALAAGEPNAKAGLSALYLGVAADIAAGMHGQEMMLADLIQEANVSLLLALEQEEPQRKDDAWLRAQIRAGIREVLEAQTQKNFEDDCLVAKVENLESAVRDLSEGENGEESKFTVGELAIILDMEIEEIQDVLRLTGDYEGES